jgi:hypothetical protein
VAGNGALAVVEQLDEPARVEAVVAAVAVAIAAKMRWWATVQAASALEAVAGSAAAAAAEEATALEPGPEPPSAAPALLTLLDWFAAEALVLVLLVS